MIAADARAYLLATPSIAALVGNRIHPLRLRQGTAFPAITYQTIGGSEAITHDGASGLAFARIQFDCWADARYEDAEALKEALWAALSGHRGTWGTTPVSAVTIVNDLDWDEPDPALWRRMLEISVLYGRAA